VPNITAEPIFKMMKIPALFGTFEKSVCENRVSSVVLGVHPQGDRIQHSPSTGYGGFSKKGDDGGGWDFCEKNNCGFFGVE